MGLNMEPLWLSNARSELGTKEFPGTPDNPRIIKYWVDANLAGVADGQDEVPWCAAFVGSMLHRANQQGSGKANARSYSTWGRNLLSPVLGCVVVLSRPPNAWQGHVGFYVSSDRAKRLIRIIGGNQSDSVSVADFSIDRIVSLRWPASQTILPEWVGPIPSVSSGPMSNRED
jgi:uncharacterized protein (TIGR02594 family)